MAMGWPSLTTFTNTIQNPGLCFADDDLKNGEFDKGHMGLPTTYSGTFACVYKISKNDSAKAVRCFTSPVTGQQKHYNDLSDFLNKISFPESFVDFKYLEEGIKVGNKWYPIVKMDWVQGSKLNEYIENQLGKPDVLWGLSSKWRGSLGGLRSVGIAHNDLQHGNVMVQNGRIQLVDYDGIFLRDTTEGSSLELGHKNYQHPRRVAEDYDEHIDNFPGLVIFLSIRALSADPDLWDKYYNQDNLVLTKNDFLDPAKSERFLALKNSQDPIVCRLTSYLAEYCDSPIDQVPDLEIIMGAVAADEPKAPRVGGVSNTSTGRPGGAASNTPSSPPSASPSKPPPISAGQAARPVTPTGQTSPAFAARRLRRTPGNAPAAATQQAPFRPSAQAPTLAPSSPTTGASSHSSPATPTVTATFPQQTNTQAQVPCQECGSSNDFLLIYCEIDGCDAVLHGTKQCRCGFYAPLNTNYCPGCGQSQV